MCGIVGVYSKSREELSLNLLKRMTEKLQHRGPDGEGYFVQKGIALAHRRLAIIDPTPRSNQPFSDSTERWTISFNGCIYNYIELKNHLRAQGISFRTSSDTEVIVEGLLIYGSEFFQRLNGMFAIAAWDSKEEKLYLSRDRFGVKPLYYWSDEKQVIFGSEIKAIIAHPSVSVEPDLNAINEYFTFQNLFSFRTLFRDVFVVPPANTICIDKHTTTISHKSWWDYDFSATDDKMSFDDAVLETKTTFEQAVKRQMVSDVPVGSYLSGGMDSGSITAIAAGQVPRLSTFTCGFDMSAVSGVEMNYDERRDAELMANHFKTQQYEQIINAGDIRWSLPRLVYHLEDLRVGMSYPNFYISQLASKFVKVCLQGTGGDELFGGYPWRYYRVFDSIDQKDFFNQYYAFWQRLVPEDDKKQLFQNHVSSEIDFDQPRGIFEKVFLFNDKLSYDRPEDHINNSLYFEIKTFLPGLLFVGDKLGMAHGLEERFPFLDNELVDLAMRIPVRHKLGNLENEVRKIDENLEMKKKVYREFDDGKNVLRRAMRDFIPEAIINRKKQGFSAPDESWYRGENAQYVKDLLLNKKTVSTEFINPEYKEKIINEHINERINHRLLIWSFMNFEWWCRIFLNGESIE